MSTSSGLGPGGFGGVERLQRHAADRAMPRTPLPDLGMHRTGIDHVGAARHGVGRGVVMMVMCGMIAAGIFRGIGEKFGAATIAAEEPGPATPVGAVLCGGGVHRHAADRVFRRRARLDVLVRHAKKPVRWKYTPWGYKPHTPGHQATPRGFPRLCGASKLQIAAFSCIFAIAPAAFPVSQSFLPKACWSQIRGPVCVFR